MKLDYQHMRTDAAQRYQHSNFGLPITRQHLIGYFVFYIMSILFMYGIDPLFNIPGHSLLGHLNIQFLILKTIVDIFICLRTNNKIGYRLNSWIHWKGLILSLFTTIILSCMFSYEINYTEERLKYYNWRLPPELDFALFRVMFSSGEMATHYKVFRDFIHVLVSVICPIFIFCNKTK